MGNRMKKSYYAASDDSGTDLHYNQAFALMKLRNREASGLSKVPKGVFRCILEYCEPVLSVRVTEHYRYNPEVPINYTWPKEVSY